MLLEVGLTVLVLVFSLLLEVEGIGSLGGACLLAVVFTGPGPFPFPVLVLVGAGSVLEVEEVCEGTEA